MQSPYLFPAGARLGEHNLVLHASARRHSVDGYAGPLSIKTVLRGRVSWVVGSRELVVDPSSFLVLAAGERYSMDIDAPKPVETCCAFFAPGFLEQIAADLTSPLEAALDSPDRTAPPLAYLSALHGDRERALTGRVCTLAERCENHDRRRDDHRWCEAARGEAKRCGLVEMFHYQNLVLVAVPF